MIDVTILRTNTGDHGTFGYVWVEGTKEFVSCEPPWKNNTTNLSCIPAGKYKAIRHRSPKYGYVYIVTDVINREYILCHAGNYGGDIKKRFKTHTKGCILLGMRLSFFGGQKTIGSSRIAMRRFHQIAAGEDLNLTILQLFRR